MPSFKIDVCKKSVKKQKIAILALLREGLYWCAKDLIFFCTFSFFFYFSNRQPWSESPGYL